MPGLRLWVNEGVLPGSFLQAVLLNDLKEACAQADTTSSHHIFGIVQWLYSFAPMQCWGSREEVVAWAEAGGKRGQGFHIPEDEARG